LLALLAALVLLVACSNQESTWDRVQHSAVLRVGLDPTYPPFEFYDGQSLTGIDVELAQAIAAEYGLAPAFVHFGFDGLYDALATEQVDVLISALPTDLTRTRDFAYSDGYFNSGLVLVSALDRRYLEAAALQGRRIAVELGAAGHVQATTWARQVQDLTVATYANSDDALRAVSQGQADAAVVDNITYRLFDQPAGANMLAAQPLTSEPYAVVVRSADDELLAAVNVALASLHDSGQLDSILNRWFPG
jgi:polar amino acid transport system substrate-binding protein